MTVAQFAAASGQVSFFPPGSILMVSGHDRQLPPGWLVCDGSVKAISDHPRLYAAIADRYNDGTEPVGHFRLPNHGPGGQYIMGALSPTMPSYLVKGGGLQHTHSFSTTINASFNSGSTVDGTHGHNVNNMNVNAGGAEGAHHHGNAGTNSGGGNSTFNTGNGNVGGGSTPNHTHAYGVNTSNNSHGNHNHNINGTNTTNSGDHRSAHNLSVDAGNTVQETSFTNGFPKSFAARMVIKT